MDKTESLAASTGLPPLDAILQGIVPGDNIVWRVDRIADYREFVTPFCEYAVQNGMKIVYFRFANHERLVSDISHVSINEIDPELGFENFITSIHKIITSVGCGGCYVFDSLSDISYDCYSDRMIGNFFRLTCPFLHELETVAYFAIDRYHHSYHAAAPIEETTQILLDVYRYKERIYVQPIKVEDRYSPSMYTLHIWEENVFTPVINSVRISEVLRSSPWAGLRSASYRQVGIWDRLFMNAESILEACKKGELSPEKEHETCLQLLPLLVSSDKKIFDLTARYFTLSDIIYIWKRMIGTGMIGGKSVGMLLARAILNKSDKRWEQVLEPHDSFFIGSDVFYTYLVENDCWWEKKKLESSAPDFKGNREVRKRILAGTFPEYILKRFGDMLDYFGQSPIIVRSSSLLEDNFGNTFAGKYESIFCTNQGTHTERMSSFLTAVKTVYASTMSVEALSYRAQRGVLEHDEQMALLVQRVSGSLNDDYYYPHFSGVGFSYNPYIWSQEIDPNAGVLRIVFGLGTRAVNRMDDDYTRVVALNAPTRRPESNFDDIKRYSQRKVDVLDLHSNKLINTYFTDIARQNKQLPIDLFATLDEELENQLRQRGITNIYPGVLTFNTILQDTDLVDNIKKIFDTLESVYTIFVDIEFTVNFTSRDAYKINIVQCRPFHVKKQKVADITLPAIAKSNIILEANSGVSGQSNAFIVDRLIYVVPAVYGGYTERERHAVARLIGILTHTQVDENGSYNIVLIGPGRWGTSTPSLGIPVSFSEINTSSVICEIDTMHEGLTPDLSLGTHFFNEMVEMDMLYIGYFAHRKDNIFNEAFLLDAPNRLLDLQPDAKNFTAAIRVLDGSGKQDGPRIYLNANVFEQRGTIYYE